VYLVYPVVHPNWLVVFAVIGAPRGSPDAVPDCPVGKADTIWAKAWTVRPCPGAPICQAGTTVVVFCPGHEFIGIPYNG
jgi:hypothetical protein